MKLVKNKMEIWNLTPNLTDIRTCFPHFRFVEQKKYEPLHQWVSRMATLNGDHSEWKYYHYRGMEWRCSFFMKKVMIASCSAKKKKDARKNAAEKALENLGVVCSERAQHKSVASGSSIGKELPEFSQHEQVPDELHEDEGGEDPLSACFVEENILEIQTKILLNQILIGDSIKHTVSSADETVRNVNTEDSRISYYNNQVVRVENSIIMRQNIILGGVGSFSVSHNAKHYEEFQMCEKQFYIISYQSGVLGSLNKCNFRKFHLNEEELYLTQQSETLKRRGPLPVNERIVGEKWNRIVENQSSILDNFLEIMCTLSGMDPDSKNRFDMLNKENNMSFLDNVITAYKYKIHFHENKISAMQNDVMCVQHRIIDDQRRIIENEGEILKVFNSCLFSKDLVYKMNGKVPFLDNELHALQLKTWAGINHLLTKMNQVYLEQIYNPKGSDDVVNYQKEVMANQKSILANLSRFPCTQNAICESQKLILCVQDEVLNHCIPTVNDYEPLREDNVGFKLLKLLGWSGGGLGTNQQGIVEPIRAEGAVGRSGLGYKKIDPKNPRKRHAQEISNKMELLENLKAKLMRPDIHSYVPLEGAVPMSVEFHPASETVKIESPECITLD